MKRTDYKMYIEKERPNDVPFFSAVELGTLVPQFTQRTSDKSFMNTLAVSTQVSVWRRAARLLNEIAIIFHKHTRTDVHTPTIVTTDQPHY